MTSTADDLASILDVVQQPAWAVDADHLVSHANPPIARIMGYDRPCDLLGIDGRPSAHPRTRTEAEAPPGVRPARGEGALTHVDGSLIPVVWSLLPLHRQTGEAVVYVFFPPPADDGGTWPVPDPFRLPEQEARPLAAQEDAQHWRRTADALQHGAQERLVGLLIGLGLVRERLGRGPGIPADVVKLLDVSLRDAEEALAHVREATATTYPGVLKLRGLKAALLALAARSPSRSPSPGTWTGGCPTRWRCTCTSWWPRRSTAPRGWPALAPSGYRSIWTPLSWSPSRTTAIRPAVRPTLPPWRPWLTTWRPWTGR